MLQLLVRVTAAPGRDDQMLAALRSVLRSARREPACLDAQLSVDVDDGSRISYSTEWPALGDFERHLRSESFTRLLSTLETAAATPVIECRLVSESRGLEYVASVRGVAE